MHPLDFIILMIAFGFVIIIDVWLSKGTQDYIDDQNERIRKDQKWRDRNNGWNEWTTLWNNRQKQRY